MKQILILLLLSPVSLFGQTEKPFFDKSTAHKTITPISPAASAKSGTTTYAVVIGISDYKDPGIPDLRFADRDAHSFADWLNAKDGLALPDSNIRFLSNQQATNAQMIVSLDWLIEQTRPGDRAFIYFSGHGDVERVTKFQRAFLLGYDSPPAVYGAGAFSLSYLQDILSTLSQNDVQVLVITDACRAGKLAGSGVGGQHATATQLAQQYANEIKILSCQPEEFSLEGEQWGGGRGCFSYHLEEALYGFADENHDDIVDLRELRRYLEDHVSKEAAPQNQTPMVFGPSQTSLAVVHEPAIAARMASKGKGIAPFLPIDSKGIESRLLEKVDTSIRRMYARFLSAIDSGQLMSPPGQSANDYFKVLMDKSEISGLYGTMKRKFAAALMDEGQTILNKVLKTDPEVLDNIFANQVHYDHLPGYFERAAEILGKQHYIWQDLKAKEFYFRAMTIREENYPDSSAEWLTATQKKLLNISLEYDSTSAICYYQLGRTFPAYSKACLEHYKKAVSLAPNWALIHYLIGDNTPQLKEAIRSLKKSIELDSTFLRPYHAISWRMADLGQKDSADLWRQKHLEKFLKKIEEDPASLKAFECEDVGLILWRLGEYERAKAFLLRGIELSAGKAILIYGSLAAVYMDLFDFENATLACRKRGWKNEEASIFFEFLNDTNSAISIWAKDELEVEFKFKQVQAWLTMRDYPKAQFLAGKYRQSGPEYGEMTFYLAESARNMGRLDSARLYYNEILDSAKVEFKQNEIIYPNFLFVAISLDRLDKQFELNQLLDTANARLAGDPWFYFTLARIYAQTNREKAAIEALQKTIELGWKPNPLHWLYGTLCDPLLNPIRETAEYKQLVQKYFPKYYDIATRIPGKH